jgi:SAM-dependent methyltransferase
MDRAILEFAKLTLTEEDVKDKSVIEIGSLDVNGSVRPIVEELSPRRYIGVDIQMGPGVDEICDAYEILEKFGRNKFDLLIATELLEHIRDWRWVISNLKHILKTNGILFITTRSKGFVYHGYPFDYWRFELSDMEAIFSDFFIESLERDSMLPGVMMKAIKPKSFRENDLYNYQLYSVITDNKTSYITNIDIFLFKVRYRIGPILSKILPLSIKRIIKKYYSNYIR